MAKKNSNEIVAKRANGKIGNVLGVSNAKLKAARAQQLATNIHGTFKAVLDEAFNRLYDIRISMSEILMSLGAQETTSLSPNNVNSRDFVREYVDLIFKEEEEGRNFNALKKNYEELFGVEYVEPLKPVDFDFDDDKDDNNNNESENESLD